MSRRKRDRQLEPSSYIYAFAKGGSLTLKSSSTWKSISSNRTEPEAATHHSTDEMRRTHGHDHSSMSRTAISHIGCHPSNHASTDEKGTGQRNRDHVPAEAHASSENTVQDLCVAQRHHSLGPALSWSVFGIFRSSRTIRTTPADDSDSCDPVVRISAACTVP